MKTADLVKRLLENGANAEAVAIALQAVDEAVEEARPRRRRRGEAKVKLASRAA